MYGFLVFLVLFSIFPFHSQFGTNIIKGELPNSTWEWDAILYSLTSCTYFLLLYCRSYAVVCGLHVYMCIVRDMKRTKTITSIRADSVYLYWCTKMNWEGTEHIGKDTFNSVSVYHWCIVFSWTNGNHMIRILFLLMRSFFNSWVLVTILFTMYFFA